MGNSSSNEENRTSNKKQSENPQSKLPLSELQSLDIDTLNKEFARNEKNDIDQKNRQLVRRWEANNKLRISFWEAYIAKVVAKR